VKLAGLYSLVATCEANGVNPLAYIEDVLTRVGHPPGRADRRPAAATLDRPRYRRVSAINH